MAVLTGEIFRVHGKSIDDLWHEIDLWERIGDRDSSLEWWFEVLIGNMTLYPKFRSLIDRV